MTDNIVVTGARGFVGARLMAKLTGQSGLQAIPLHLDDQFFNGQVVPDLNGAQCLIHLAARVHVMRDTHANPLHEFRRVNTLGTARLARRAAAQGVRRMVFVSSIKVNGEATQFGSAFVESDPPAPQDNYAVSKHEAEVELRDIAASTGMELVIIRPPLVYGAGVRANFASLLKLVRTGLPLPLGCIDNRRSLIGLDNLVSLIALCTAHPAAANETFLVADGEDVSTPELVRRIAAAQGRAAHLLPVPVQLLRTAAALVGKRAAAQRLCDNLQVDASKARTLLQWRPPFTLDGGLRMTVSAAGSRAGTRSGV